MTTLKRAPSLSLVQIAYDTIVGAIFEQQLNPNDALNIDELAQQLEMSNTPVREALARAKIEGLVRKESNKSYTVALLFSASEYQQLFDARVLLEEYAVKNSQAVDLDTLQSLASRMITAQRGNTYEEYSGWIGYDRQFHSTLVDGGGNPFVSRAWRDLNFHLHIYRLHRFDDKAGDSFDHQGDSAVRDHACIVDHLVSGDAEAAAQKIVQHIRNTQDSILPLTKKVSGDTSL